MIGFSVKRKLFFIIFASACNGLAAAWRYKYLLRAPSPIIQANKQINKLVRRKQRDIRQRGSDRVGSVKPSNPEIRSE